MSHNINFSVYEEKVNKRSVQEKWDEVARHEDWQEGCSGLPKDIQWKDIVLDSYEAAETYINEHDSGWYDQLAVKFKRMPNVKINPSKKLLSMKERTEKLCEKYCEAKMRIHYANIKSAFVGCKNCSSKISTAYIKSNNCPVCGKELRPASTLDAIMRMQSAYEKAKEEEVEQLKLEKAKAIKKAGKSSEICWLVKTEYHT